MTEKGRAFGVALLAGCVLSLAGVRPLRSLEQGLSPLLAPLEGLARGWLPRHDDETLLLLRDPAQQAFEAWQRDVRGSVPAAAPGLSPLLVTVVARDPERHELELAVPAGGVALDAAVTHRSVLLGFVTALAADGTRATVTLLGQPAARPVAAEWCVQPDARPVSFLVTGSERDSDWAMRVEAPSSSVRPPSDQLAWTRDVSALGDHLPPHLLIGRLQHPETDGRGQDVPGGGVPRASSGEMRLVPLIDAFAIDLVTVEGRPGASRTCRQAGARLFATCRSSHALRLDVGSSVGIERGDWVLQDGLFVGVVAVVSPWGALVDSDALPVTLLDASPTGEVVACGPAATSWPAGWQPACGDLIASGHLAAGGVVVGTVSAFDEDGLQIERSAPDCRRPVQVVGP